MGKQRAWSALVAAIVSGVGMGLLVPPVDAGGAVWLCLVPLLWAVWSGHAKHLRGAWRGFALGWVAGMVGFGLQLRWLSEVSWLGALALPAYLAIYPGVYGAFAATLGRPRGVGAAESLRVALWHAGVWAGLEWLRGWMITGFGWNGLGVAFHGSPVLAQAADLLGVCGLSMVPVFFQVVLVQSLGRVLRGARDGKRRTRLDLMVAAAVVMAVVVYGLVRMAALRGGDTLRLRALLVQLDIPQEAARQLWSAEEIHIGYEDETLKGLAKVADDAASRLREAMEQGNSGSVAVRSPDWVMWPECALNGRLLTAPDGSWGMSLENQTTIDRVREGGDFTLLFGVTESEAEDMGDGQLVENPRGEAWNSLVALSPQGDLAIYRKHHLVIFGEYIPWIEQFPWLRRIYEQQAGVEYGGAFSVGQIMDPMNIPLSTGESVRAIPTVCFEDTVPRLVRKFARSGGPQVIVNATNDGWFKSSPAAAQHFANAIFRAIELRRPMLRCANTGVSAAVDVLGTTDHPDTGKPQILTDAMGSHFTRGSLLVDVDVPRRPVTTLYARIGDWGVIGIAAACWIWAALVARVARSDA